MLRVQLIQLITMIKLLLLLKSMAYLLQSKQLMAAAGRPLSRTQRPTLAPGRAPTGTKAEALEEARALAKRATLDLRASVGAARDGARERRAAQQEAVACAKAAARMASTGTKCRRIARMTISNLSVPRKIAFDYLSNCCIAPVNTCSTSGAVRET